MRKEQQSYRGESTRAVHSGEERDKFARSLTNPIAQTSTFVFDNLDEFTDFKAGKVKHFEYGRYGNPTVRAAEHKLAALEGGEEALLFPTGMSAVTSVLLAMLRQGQHVVLMQDCYRRTVLCHPAIGRRWQRRCSPLPASSSPSRPPIPICM
jgi:cystathionine gamma-synthase